MATATTAKITYTTPKALSEAFQDLFANYNQIKNAYTLDPKFTNTIEENFRAWQAQVDKKPIFDAALLASWNYIYDTTQSAINAAIGAGKEPGGMTKNQKWFLALGTAAVGAMVFFTRKRRHWLEK